LVGGRGKRSAARCRPRSRGPQHSVDRVQPAASRVTRRKKRCRLQRARTRAGRQAGFTFWSALGGVTRRILVGARPWRSSASIARRRARSAIRTAKRAVVVANEETSRRAGHCSRRSFVPPTGETKSQPDHSQCRSTTRRGVVFFCQPIATSTAARSCSRGAVDVISQAGSARVSAEAVGASNRDDFPPPPPAHPHPPPCAATLPPPRSCSGPRIRCPGYRSRRRADIRLSLHGRRPRGDPSRRRAPPPWHRLGKEPDPPAVDAPRSPTSAHAARPHHRHRPRPGKLDRRRDRQQKTRVRYGVRWTWPTCWHDSAGLTSPACWKA